jgi:KH/beta-lactamase-domain protein
LVPSFGDEQAKITESILQNVPKEAEITRIEFEGPRIAIYTKRPEILLDQSYVITEIVNLIRKRLVVRSDPSVRLSEQETIKAIHTIVPPEAEITEIYFDPTVGEVVVEAKKPGLVIGKDGAALQEIIRATKWRPRVLRTPPIPSKIVSHMRHYLHSEAKDRERILRTVGERIFRSPVVKVGDVRITMLGGFQQVGRTAILVRAGESQILLDCGINPGADAATEAFPRLDVEEFDLSSLEAVVVSHAHLDHCGYLPFLYKYGFDGPVYCSEPTASLMTLLQLDYLDVLGKEGSMPPYDQKDVREMVLHVMPLKYGAVTDVAPDIRLTLHNAGHILGSSVVHLHIGEGLHNIVYTGDYKYGQTMLLEPATVTFPRVETLITESTYGAQEDIMPPRKEVEERLVSIINKTLEGGGKALIPVPAVGRAQEIMLVLDEYMRQGLLKEAPVYLEGMINEATAIHTAYPEYLARSVRDQILYQGVNPFQSNYFTTIEKPDAREAAIEGGPCVIVATSGMLEGGPSMEYFRRLSSDSRNTLIFVSYQIDGTLGRRVQKGLTEAPMMNSGGKMEVVKVGVGIEAVEGFSGHSDRAQILNYVRRVAPKPEVVIVGHGERAKCIGVARLLQRMYRLDSRAPENLETIRLR